MAMSLDVHLGYPSGQSAVRKEKQKGEKGRRIGKEKREGGRDGALLHSLTGTSLRP